MFCSQCGNRVPDGSRFCGLCGTKISVDVETPTIQRDSESNFRYSQSTDFDWSGVKGEPHKKYVRDVVSPWGSTGLTEEPEPVEKQETPQERSRTMSFIDILKKEREEKAFEEEASAARAEEERKNHAQSSPSVYIPPVYDDVSSPVITPFDAPMYSITESQQYAAPRVTRPEVTIPPASSVEIPRMTQAVEYTNLNESRYHEAPAVSPSAEYVEANRARLTAELSSILDADSGRHVAPRTATNAYEDRYAENRYTENRYTDNRDLTDVYLSMKQPRTPRTAAPRSHAAPVYDEPMPAYEQPAPAYTRPAPVYDRPAHQAPAVGSNTAEIEALKARLAELMGASITGQVEMPEPVMIDPIIEPPMVETVTEQAQPVQEPTPVVEPQPVAEPTFTPQPLYEEPAQEAAEELPLIDPTPEVEEELPLINDELEKAVTATVDNKESGTDAMSVKDLEKDLFGEVSEEDIQAEETKKIDKFYTLYKKNEEFQKLLDEEYNKLKSENEEVPTVSAVLGEDAKKEETKASTPVKEAKPSAADMAVSTKSSQVAADEDDEDEAPSKGGTALTVIAVIIAILLVVLLAVILVLNFAPDSAIALQIDSIIETITSYFSGVEIPGRLLL